MGDKIMVKGVTITRHEGPNSGNDFTPHGFNNLPDGNKHLMTMAETAPDSGGYDKVNFLVTFDDANTYEGQFDLKREHMDGASIGGQMDNHANFMAGRWPSWMDAEQYREFRADQERNDAGAEERWGAFLDGYNINDHQRR